VAKGKEAKGIFRVEVRLTKPKTIHKYTDESVTSKQIKSLALNSKEIFLETFTHIVPFGDYYKKKQALEMIEDNIINKKQKEKMLQLIELITNKEISTACSKRNELSKIEKVMDAFAELNLSPVTISKRHNIKHLKNLYTYLSK